VRLTIEPLRSVFSSSLLHILSLALTDYVWTRFANPGDGIVDDLVDAVGKPCTSDSECPSGGGVNLVCCDLFGDKLCFESYACSVF
jgi:hypothetical protein